jgi:hypothetical protein
MRWLMIGLLASLGVLLLVAGAVARHIWLRRKELRSEPNALRDAQNPDPEIES